VTDTNSPILEVRDLAVEFTTEAGKLRAVDSVSFAVRRGRTLGIVGESGCGKSVSAMSILRLVPNPPGRIVGGKILWKGKDIVAMPARELPTIRGKEIAMIFQDPMTSLNPVFTVERQMVEVLMMRFAMDKASSRQRSLEMLRKVGIAEPEARLASYPHELSGGMKQRIMIAMALLCEPDLLIADEPTTALDVTIQAQILYMMKSLQKELGAAIILITHDMGVVAETCDEVAVMYAGRVVETGPVVDVFERSRHPYTRGLLHSIPKKGASKKAPLPTIEGVVPSLLNPPVGCRFADRCTHRRELGEEASARCFAEDPHLETHEDRGVEIDIKVACHFPLVEANA
jgi:oligopeptide/dipeptide ABC transporter ATP-binding protein